MTHQIIYLKPWSDNENSSILRALKTNEVVAFILRYNDNWEGRVGSTEAFKGLNREIIRRKINDHLHQTSHRILTHRHMNLA